MRRLLGQDLCYFRFYIDFQENQPPTQTTEAAQSRSINLAEKKVKQKVNQEDLGISINNSKGRVSETVDELYCLLHEIKKAE